MQNPDRVELTGIFYGNRAKSLVEQAMKNPEIDLIESAAFGESYLIDIPDRNTTRSVFVPVPRNSIYVHISGPARVIKGTDFWIQVDGLKK